MTHGMTFIAIIFFILAAVGILFGSHYILFISAVNFFYLSSYSYKIILASVLSFLAVSFFISSLLVRWRENYLTRAYYFISGFWLGLVANLILALGAAWATVWIMSLAQIDPRKEVLAVIFIAAALAYSIYGSRKGFEPKIKKITVNIPNLPDEWKGQTIVQLSDIHLGHIHKARFMRNVVEKVNSVRPKLVVITGDLMDGMDGNLDNPMSPINDIKSEKGIYFVTGNHETYLGLDEAYSALKKTNINILNDEVVDLGGLKLIGINYPSRGEKKDVPAILESLKKDFYGKPNIFLYHSPVKISQFKECGVNLQLSGHTHKGQVFPFGYVAQIAYKGYAFGLHQIGDYTLYTSSGTGTWGPPMRTENRSEIVAITLE